MLKNILDKAVSEFGDVAHAVGARHQLHECAELFDRDNFAFEHGANLDLGAKRFDFQFGLRRFGRVGTRNEHGSVFFHIDLRAGSLLKRADCFSAWTNELADLLWINLDLGDAWSELRHLSAWLGDDGFDLVDELQTTFTRLREDDGDFLKAKSACLQIQLNSRDSITSSADLEIHFAKEILFANDVGDVRHLSIFGGEATHADARARGLDRHARIHHCKATTAHACH